MIIGLVALLWVLKVVLVLAVLAIVALGADYVYFEIKKNSKVALQEAAEKPTNSDTPNIDVLLRNAKAQRRYHDKSEEAAWDEFFETPYIPGFENNGSLRNYGGRPLSRKAYQFFNTMEELSAKVAQQQKDATIFKNTEDL
jgi:hypothetical protein